MTSHVLERVLVPIANEDDARATCDAIERHLDAETAVVAVHVIEKAVGAPDKAPLEARQAQAAATFDLVESELEGTKYDLTTDLRYAKSIVEAIADAATDHDVTAIVFTPRNSGRITRFLTGNKTRTLVATSDVPVFVLPRTADDPLELEC